jgi:hypothetical protein
MFQMAVHHAQSSRTGLNILASTAVTAATRSSTALGGSAHTCSFRYPRRKTSELGPATEEAMQSALDRHVQALLEIFPCAQTAISVYLTTRGTAFRVEQFPQNHDIVMCRVVRVTIITGSSSDDWIY